MAERPDAWYDDFWGNNPPIDDDHAISAVRLIAEMAADGLIYRDGDYIVGNDVGCRTHLTADDQWLVRQIIDAIPLGGDDK